MSVLKVPQARVLAALSDSGGALTRAKMSTQAGFTEVSGTVTRALNGLREGSSSGAAHPGLVALGYVERLELDIDGLVETCYRITDEGQEALDVYISEVGLPELRDRASSTNKRYGRAADAGAEAQG